MNEIIQNLQLRLHQNNAKMTEIGKTLTNMKSSLESEKIPFRKQFHLIEDEQTSIQKLIDKLQKLLSENNVDT